MTETKPFRLLASTQDVTPFAPFIAELHKAGAGVLASSGTLGKLAKAGIAGSSVILGDGFPEMFTPDLKIGVARGAMFAGVLANRNSPEEMKAINTCGIDKIDLLIISPYAQAKEPADFDLGTIDFSLSLIEAAIKRGNAIPVVYAADLETVTGELLKTANKSTGPLWQIPPMLRSELSVKAQGFLYERQYSQFMGVTARHAAGKLYA